MMKHGCNLQCDEEHNEHQRRDTEHDYCQRKEGDGKEHFAEMKSRGSAYIEAEIGVMHVMKDPEERNHVHGPMPPLVSIVHAQTRCNHSKPAGKWSAAQQANRSVRCPQCKSDGKR